MRRIFLKFLASSLYIFSLCSAAYAQNNYESLDPLSYGEEARLPFSSSPPPAQSTQGMVSSVHWLASQAGVEMLKKHGNAADAAAATGYALAVVYPCAGSLGGGGFMLIKPPSQAATFMDFREKAPLTASKDMFLNAQGNVEKDQSVIGWRSVATPGTVAGLDALHNKWGRLPRKVVMAPAIRLAQQGFLLTKNDVEILQIAAPSFRQDPYARAVFLHRDGTLPCPGDRLVQPDLARSLTYIAQFGRDGFYRGDIAREIIHQAQTHNALLSMEDLKHYQTRNLAPLTCSYRGRDIITSPAPSAGGIALCEMLSILNGFDLQKTTVTSVRGRHAEIEAMRQAFADRPSIGDPAYTPFQPQKLLNADYIARIRDKIARHQIPHLHVANQFPEKKQTTHFSVIDKDGFAISTTQTLNGWFGGRVMAGRSGIVMNDEMDDFSIKAGAKNMYGIPGSQANEIAPGKTPISSMAPTLLMQNNRPVMVIGSPGGSRIPTTILSVIMGSIDQHLNIQQAIDMSRIHEQWQPDTVEAEKGALSSYVKSQLKAQGYHIYERSPWGMAEGITITYPPHKDPIFYGGHDRRHPGGASQGG